MNTFINKYGQDYPGMESKMILKKVKEALRAAEEGEKEKEVLYLQEAYTMLLEYLEECGYTLAGGRQQPQGHFYPMFPFYSQRGQGGGQGGGTQGRQGGSSGGQSSR